jgi:4-amino-4-deoxy-L-arabinose transferase-like glycosyltransferase
LSKSLLSRLNSLIDVKIVILIIVALHLFVISFPQKSMVFDEAFYVPAARDILNGTASNPEHPFLGKAWIALGIFSFGDNWFGWRIVPTIFSILSLIVFYFIAKRFLGERLAVYSTALLGFEVIFFIHGSLALLEVPSIFFALLGFWLYLERRGRKIGGISVSYWLAAVMMGVSFLSKETAAFFIIAVIFLYLSTIKYSKYRDLLPKFWKGLVLILVLAGVYLVPVTIYDQLYKPSSSTEVVVTETVVQMKDPQGEITATTTVTNTSTRKNIIKNGVDHTLFMVSYASGLHITNDSTVDSGNYAWNWILPVPSYPPAPYYVENAEVRHTTKAGDQIIDVTTENKHPVAWYGIGTLPIWWSIWIIVPFSIYQISKRYGKEIDHFLLIWISCTYLPMLYISGIAGRIVYPFYFIQTVPALTIGIPYFINSVLKDRIIRNIVLLTFLLIVLTFFFHYFPVQVNQF